MTDFYAPPRAALEAQLEPGEELLGICAASRQQGMFKGGSVALGITEGRLLVQPLDRKGQPDGPAMSLPPERIAKAEAGDAGGGWMTATAAIADHTAVRLKLRTTDGEKINLMLMRGEGRLLGKLSGGAGQARGVRALGDWFARHAEA